MPCTFLDELLPRAEAAVRDVAMVGILSARGASRRNFFAWKQTSQRFGMVDENSYFESISILSQENDRVWLVGGDA